MYAPTLISLFCLVTVPCLGAQIEVDEIQGLTEGDRFGYSVAGLGDVDADGYVDFVSNAPFNHDFGLNSGRTCASVFRG